MNAQRAISVFLFTAFLAALARPQLDQKVTFETKATTAPKAIEALAKAVNADLKAGPEFANEPLILAVHDMTLQALMDRIASVTLGKWEQSGTTYRLVRDKEKLQALTAAKFSERSAGFKDAVAQYVKQHADEAAWNEKYVQDLINKERESRSKLLEDLAKNNPDIGTARVNIMKGSSRASSPASPAMIEVLKHLPSDALASVAPGTRAVFSSSPTRMQKGLPFPTAGIINRFVDSHNLLARLSGGKSGVPDNVHFTGGLDIGAKPISAPVTKMLLILTRSQNSEGISCVLKFADSSGAIIGQANSWLQPEAKPAETGDRSKFESADDVNISELSLEVAKALVNGRANDGAQNNVFVFGGDSGTFRIGSDSPTPGPSISKEALALLSDPVRNDPQSTFVSEALLSSAKALHRDLVASLPDEVVLPLARALNQPVKAGQVWDKVQEAKARVAELDGCILASPLDRIASASKQMDRAAAGRLLGVLTSKGYPRLYDLAKYSQSFAIGLVPDNLGLITLQTVDPFAQAAFVAAFEQRPALLQFLGTFNPTVFEGLNKNNDMTVASLSPPQRAYLERDAYGPDGFGGIIGLGDFVGISINSGDSPPQEPKGPSLADEPTEAMPNGLPLEGKVGLTFSPMGAVQGLFKNARNGQFLTAGALGGMRAMQANNSVPELAGKMLQYDSYVPAQGFKVTLQREFVKGANAKNDYEDFWLPSGATAVAFDKLPSDFLDAVKKAQEEMSKAGMHFGGRGNKPPL
ncbi:MAG: hypothetical protein JSS66_13260 [Armatimonadetes bacterium]|nr:hypothetical protein [Armatimonadota bacterium]